MEGHESVRIGAENELELSKALMRTVIDRDNNIGAVAFSIAKTKDGVEIDMQGFLPSELDLIGKFCEELLVAFSDLAIKSIAQSGEKHIAEMAENGHPVIKAILSRSGGELPPEFIEQAHKAMATMTFLKVFQKVGDRVFNEGKHGDEDGDDCDCESCRAEKSEPPISSKDR